MRCESKLLNGKNVCLMMMRTVTDFIRFVSFRVRSDAKLSNGVGPRGEFGGASSLFEARRLRRRAETRRIERTHRGPGRTRRAERLLRRRRRQGPFTRERPGSSPRGDVQTRFAKARHHVRRHKVDDFGELRVRTDEALWQGVDETFIRRRRASDDKVTAQIWFNDDPFIHARVHFTAMIRRKRRQPEVTVRQPLARVGDVGVRIARRDVQTAKPHRVFHLQPQRERFQPAFPHFRGARIIFKRFSTHRSRRALERSKRLILFL